MARVLRRRCMGVFRSRRWGVRAVAARSDHDGGGGAGRGRRGPGGDGRDELSSESGGAVGPRLRGRDAGGGAAHRADAAAGPERVGDRRGVRVPAGRRVRAAGGDAWDRGFLRAASIGWESLEAEPLGRGRGCVTGARSSWSGVWCRCPPIPGRAASSTPRGCARWGSRTCSTGLRRARASGIPGSTSWRRNWTTSGITCGRGWSRGGRSRRVYGGVWSGSRWRSGRPSAGSRGASTAATRPMTTGGRRWRGRRRRPGSLWGRRPSLSLSQGERGLRTRWAASAAVALPPSPQPSPSRERGPEAEAVGCGGLWGGRAVGGCAAVALPPSPPTLSLAGEGAGGRRR